MELEPGVWPSALVAGDRLALRNRAAYLTCARVTINGATPRDVVLAPNGTGRAEWEIHVPATPGTFRLVFETPGDRLGHVFPVLPAVPAVVEARPLTLRAPRRLLLPKGATLRWERPYRAWIQALATLGNTPPYFAQSGTTLEAQYCGFALCVSLLRVHVAKSQADIYLIENERCEANALAARLAKHTCAFTPNANPAFQARLSVALAQVSPLFNHLEDNGKGIVFTLTRFIRGLGRSRLPFPVWAYALTTFHATNDATRQFPGSQRALPDVAALEGAYARAETLRDRCLLGLAALHVGTKPLAERALADVLAAAEPDPGGGLRWPREARWWERGQGPFDVHALALELLARAAQTLLQCRKGRDWGGTNPTLAALSGLLAVRDAPWFTHLCPAPFCRQEGDAIRLAPNAPPMAASSCVAPHRRTAPTCLA